VIARRLITPFLLVLNLALPARADDFFRFNDNSVSLLSGWGFELTGNHVSVLTLENVNTWRYGDFYGFLDFRKQHDHPSNTHSWYGELSPRFSLSDIAGLAFGDGLVKDVLVATTWERGEGGNESFLVGAGVTLDVSGFTFLKANLYARMDKSRGSGWDDTQITINWKYPFTIGNHRFHTVGYTDFVFGWGPGERNLHINPQINWDAGERMGAPNRYFLGLELDYWSNQFGVRNSGRVDTHQMAISLMLKMHL